MDKICSKCLKIKPEEDFWARKDRPSGLYSQCKSCHSHRRKKLWSEDVTYRSRLDAAKKHWNRTHKKEMREYNRNYNCNHREEINRRLQKRKQNDPDFKTLCNLKSRVLEAIRRQRTNKAYKTKELLGCTVPQLMRHLESQFDNRMTWANHGRNGWHIDHIIPCAVFDLTLPEEQKKCFHYSNLRPLWHSDNYQKSSWFDGKKHKCP